MNLPQIRLQSTAAQIEINTTPAQQSMEQPGPDLDIQQPPAELHIDRTPGQLTIDQSQARADMDLKSISQRWRDIAQKGHQDSLNGIARRAQEGNELMKIENKGNTIVNISKRNSERPTYDINIGFIPSAGSVKEHFEPAKVDIQWDLKKPINNSKPRKPIIDYKPGNVNVSMKQYQELKIDFVNLKYVGIHYEQEI
ncbi:DUF6470 family protein [Bacillus sp. FJAT-49736]|uniref:DUF6470 family protein n=1 Tax=Bacillus sp. FJAT-49736 TaxID=2833582 RepID=UPI001BCA063E|nr:DUF6470 family protein [Bacillus sp. FJAT-49736]MBS4174162.1 hypothetical protein [Bacillus sp. FJAT-49736]